MQSRETQITMVKRKNAGGQTKRANERSFVYRPPAWRRWRKVKTTYTAEFARNGILTDCIEIQRESSPCWCRSIPLDFELEQGNYATHERTAKKCTQITVHVKTPCCCCFTIETFGIKKRGPVQVRDSTRVFFAYSQKIDNSESFIEIFLIIKVSNIIFIEGA